MGLFSILLWVVLAGVVIVLAHKRMSEKFSAESGSSTDPLFADSGDPGPGELNLTHHDSGPMHAGSASFDGGHSGECADAGGHADCGGHH